MNEQEVMAIAKAAYMSGQSDKFAGYSKHNKNFQFKDERSESDIYFSFVYRNWSISYEADDNWCDMCGRFEEIDNDLLKILGRDDLMEIIQGNYSPPGLRDQAETAPRMVLKGLAPDSRAVSTVVRRSASASAAHLAR